MINASHYVKCERMYQANVNIGLRTRHCTSSPFALLQYMTPFGDGVIATLDTCIGYETCEELFVGNRYSISCVLVFICDR